MDRYYNSQRSRSPPSQNRSNSSRNHIGNEPKIENKNLTKKIIQDLPEYIPLSSHSQDSKRHSDSDRSRNGRRSPSNRRSSERNLSPLIRQQQQQQRRRISPPRKSPPPRERDRHSREKESRRIIYDDNNSRSSSTCSSRNRNNHQRSRSPVMNLLNNNCYRQRSRTNSLERNNRSIISRLGSKVSGDDSDNPFLPYERSVIEDYQIDGRPSHRREDPADMRIIIHNDQRNAFPATQQVLHHHQQQRNEREEMILAIRALEQQNEENFQHIDGIRMTVENYQREISKLSLIVHSTSKDIERLKSRLVDIPPSNGFNF